MQARAVSAGSGWNWIVGGFSLFRKNPIIWIVLFFVYLLIGMALSLIPLVGSIGFNLIAPVFMAGFMLGCRAMEMGEELEISHLFGGFRHNTAQLITVGGIYLVGIIVAVGVAMLVSGGAFYGAMLAAEQVMQAAPAQPPGAPMLLAVLAMLVCLLPLVMAYWFAPALVVFHDMPAVAAMKLSFHACLRNLVPFLVYTLAIMVLMVLAILPFGLGLLVLIPTMTASLYVSYRDIFGIRLRDEQGVMEG